MARKPNYRFERAERSRKKTEKKAERLKKKREKKATGEAETSASDADPSTAQDA